MPNGSSTRTRCTWVPYNIEFAGNIFGRQGYPFVVYRGGVALGIETNQNVLVTPKIDTFRLDNVWTTDIRVARAFRLPRATGRTNIKLIADVFNLFNANTEVAGWAIRVQPGPPRTSIHWQRTSARESCASESSSASRNTMGARDCHVLCALLGSAPPRRSSSYRINDLRGLLGGIAACIRPIVPAICPCRLIQAVDAFARSASLVIA